MCGHSIKGRNTYYTICLLINALVMYQILLVSKGVSNIFVKIIVEYNPLNTLFFLCVTNRKSFWFMIIPIIILYNNIIIYKETIMGKPHRVYIGLLAYILWINIQERLAWNHYLF